MLSTYDFDEILYSHPLVLVEFMPSSHGDTEDESSMEAFDGFQVENIKGFGAMEAGARRVRPKTIEYYPRIMGGPLFDFETSQKLALCKSGDIKFENNGLSQDVDCQLTYALFLDGKLVAVTHDPFSSSEDVKGWVNKSLKDFLDPLWEYRQFIEGKKREQELLKKEALKKAMEEGLEKFE